MCVCVSTLVCLTCGQHRYIMRCVMDNNEPVYTKGLPAAMCAWQRGGEDRECKSGCGKVSGERQREDDRERKREGAVRAL